MPKPLKCASDLPDRTSENQRGAKSATLGRVSAPRHELRASASPWRSQGTSFRKPARAGKGTRRYLIIESIAKMRTTLSCKTIAK
jgi:hypothetical protein